MAEDGDAGMEQRTLWMHSSVHDGLSIVNSGVKRVICNQKNGRPAVYKQFP